MLYYDRINLSDGTNVAKSNDSKGCIIIVTIGFLIMGSNFKILYVMGAII